MTLAVDDPRHGTANGYNNLKCRCGVCREAWRVWKLAQSRRLGINKPMAEEVARRHAEAEQRNAHGTPQRYWIGCRCAKCKAAEAAYQRERRLARKLVVA